MKSSCGRLTRHSCRTVSPPTPESKSPIGLSRTSGVAASAARFAPNVTSSMRMHSNIRGCCFPRAEGLWPKGLRASVCGMSPGPGKSRKPPLAPGGLLIRVRGRVQGVGFRPFVKRLAEAEGLAGRVWNHPEGVEIEVAGPSRELQSFLTRLSAEPPPLAQIESVESESCLLYTSDAADEEDSVDLGGRRI